jgi:hypothetical protein
MEKAGRHAGLPSGQGYEQYADAMNKMVMDNYGSVDNFKKTLAEHPAQALMDISAVMTGGGSLAGKLPGIAGKIGEGVAAAGNAIDPMLLPAKAVTGVAKGTNALIKHTIGERTAGAESLGHAYEAGARAPMTPEWIKEPTDTAARDFRENIRGQVPIETPVDDALKAMHNMVNEKNSGYNIGMAQAGLNGPISAASYRKLQNGIQEADRVAQDKGFTINEAAVEAHNKLQNIVSEWIQNPDMHSVKDLDSLKQRIGEFRDTTTGKARIVANHYYDAALKGITEQAPKYAQVMEDYQEAVKELKQVQNSFSLPANERKLNIDTALRKFQSVLRNNANTNYGYRKTLLGLLQESGAPNIEFKLAGQALNTTTPRGLSRVAAEKGAELATGMMALFAGRPEIMAAALKAAAISFATSTPRLMGETAYYAGRASTPIKAVFNRPNARILNQAGGPYVGPNLGPLQGQARGGAVQRALRLTKRG